MVGKGMASRDIPAWAPVWVGCGLAMVLLAWLLMPVWTPVAVRVPGRDRPEGSVSVSNPRDVFSRGTLVTGLGKPSRHAGSWPRFRGVSLDGISREALSLQGAWSAGQPDALWSVDVGEGYAGPAVVEGRVYLMDYDREHQRDALRCLSFEDGQEIWRYSYPMAVKRNHGLTRTVPTVAEGMVVAMGPKCHVVCVEAGTGRFRWGLDLVKDYGATLPPWYTGQCPLVDGDAVILAPGAEGALLMSVDLRNGTVRWKTPNPRGWKMTHASVVPLVVNGRRWYLYPGSGGVAAVSAADGGLAWDTTDWRINIATVPSPVLADEGRVLFTGGYNAGSLLMQFKEVNGRLEGSPVWRVKADVFGATQHSPVWYQGHFYGIRADGRVVCLGMDGKVIWTSGADSQFGLGPLMVADGNVLAMADDGRLTVLAASPDGYRPRGKVQVMEGHEVWAPMALAGGRLLVRDLTRMVCLDLARPR